MDMSKLSFFITVNDCVHTCMSKSVCVCASLEVSHYHTEKFLSCTADKRGGSSQEWGVREKERVCLRKNNKLPLIWLRTHAALLSLSLRLYKHRMCSSHSYPQEEDTCCCCSRFMSLDHFLFQLLSLPSLPFCLEFISLSVVFYLTPSWKLSTFLTFSNSIFYPIAPCFHFLSNCVYPTLLHHSELFFPLLFYLSFIPLLDSSFAFTFILCHSFSSTTLW